MIELDRNPRVKQQASWLNTNERWYFDENRVEHTAWEFFNLKYEEVYMNDQIPDRNG